jgi:hypothetical protein
VAPCLATAPPASGEKLLETGAEEAVHARQGEKLRRVRLSLRTAMRQLQRRYAMANGSVEEFVPGGGGPGKEFAKLTKHVLPLGLYLGILTVVLLGLLIWQWPRCETDSCKAGSQAQPGSASMTPRPGAPLEASAGETSSSATGASAQVAQVTGTAAAPGPAPNPPPNPPPASPPATKAVEVSSVDPASGSICGGTAVRVAGSGFLQGAQVRFGGLAASGVIVGSDTALTATTPMHLEGAVDVGVKVKEKDATLGKGFNYVCPDRTQSKLLLLVVLAGALGGVLHAGRSLFSFVGNRNLRVSWLWMYYFLPLNGAVVGALFFLVMLAGLFSVQGNTAQSFFLIIGVAAIVGMFSQQAVEKLKQISEAILTKLPPSADQKPKPLTVATLTPTQGPTAGGTAVVLTGTGFASGATVSFGGVAASGVKVTSERIDAVTPAHAAGKVDVEVCNPDSGMARKTAGFEYVADGTHPPAGGPQGPAAGGSLPAAGGPGPQAGVPGAVDAGPAPAAGGPGAVGAGQAPAVGEPAPAAGGIPAPAAGGAAGPLGGGAAPAQEASSTGGGGPVAAGAPLVPPGGK